jgi:hypothetical protein
LKVMVAGAAGFSITGDRCSGRSLGPGKSCTVSVRFAPTSLGTVTATLTAAGKKPAATATVALTGTGVGLGAVPAHLYWTNGADGTINVANLDGSSPRVLVGGQNPPAGVAVTSTHVYWVNPNGGTVNQANLDGSGAHALFTGQSSLGVAVGP